MTNLVIEAVKAPLEIREGGKVCVAGTRVTLDVIVTAFDLGSTPEEIVQSFPSVGLPDVYAVITYYLQNREAVHEYLREREAIADDVRQENERRFPSDGLRERLLARHRRNQRPE